MHSGMCLSTTLGLKKKEMAENSWKENSTGYVSRKSRKKNGDDEKRGVLSRNER